MGGERGGKRESGRERASDASFLPFPLFPHPDIRCRRRRSSDSPFLRQPHFTSFFFAKSENGGFITSNVEWEKGMNTTGEEENLPLPHSQGKKRVNKRLASEEGAHQRRKEERGKDLPSLPLFAPLPFPYFYCEGREEWRRRRRRPEYM